MKQYKHDCDLCTFLGNDRIDGKSVDVYICLENRPWPSMIIRFSGEPSDYTSVPVPFLQDREKTPFDEVAQHWYNRYDTGMDMQNLWRLEPEHFELFKMVHRRHMKAMGTDNQRKYAYENIHKVLWDPKEVCLKVYYEDEWWHYDKRLVWW